MLAELALAGFALFAPLEEKELPLGDSGVSVRVATVWPPQVHKGWMPCLVQVTNTSERQRSVDVRATAWGVDREVRATIEVAAGSESTLELLLPAFANTQNQFSVSAELEGRKHGLPGNFGGSEVGQAGAHSILYLSEGEPEPGATERWTGELSTEVVGGERVGAGPAALRALGYAAGGHAAPRIVASGTTSVPASGATPDNVRVHHVRFDQLPQRSEAYSSVDVVVVDTARGLPSERVLAPLFAWMRLGGTVALFGPRAESLARTSSELALWMEPRFEMAEDFELQLELPPDGEPHVEFGLVGATAGWRAGLGLLFVDDADAFSTPQQHIALRWAALAGDGMVHDDFGSRMKTNRPILPDLFALPYKSFALLLVLFAIVIGPVNFILVKRFKRPVLLLLTIPAIALVAALGLFVFGLLSQGLGVKIASHTFALLDQRDHRSMASEVRMLFAGLAPARGLEPGAGASTHALARYSSNSQWVPPVYDGQEYRVEHDPGVVLSGGFLPARTAFQHQIVTDRAERGRLELARDGAGLAATNALGTTVEQLLVRDAAGKYWTDDEPLGPSGRAVLRPLDEHEAATLALTLGLETLMPKVEALPPACYLARLERGVFGDDCGVTGTEHVSYHHVLGVLASDGEEWR